MSAWNRDSILDLARSYQQPVVLAAAVELEVFPAIGAGAKSAEELAERFQIKVRPLSTLLDAVAGMGLLIKSGEWYSIPPELQPLLTPGPASILPGLRHLAFLLPRWAGLAETVRTGLPYTAREGYEPPPGALEAFIGAMHNFAAPEAAALAGKIPLEGVSNLLDVGAGPGTHAIAFMQRFPQLSVALYDRPSVVEMARRNLTAAGFGQRAAFIGGDFYAEELPAGCDAAWVSAIIHMNSREQNRDFFANIFRALTPGGKVFIRDHVMSASHTEPLSGTLFAINMLVSTAGGGTYSFQEISEDLSQAGFVDVQLLEGQAEMNCLVCARKP